MRTRILAVIALSFFAARSDAQQVLVPFTNYTQDFNNVGLGIPTNWSVRTGASSTALGSTVTYTGTNTAWDNTTGAFKNFASATGLTGTETAAVQGVQNNRALGIRQTGAFGDPGASFNFNFNSSAAVVSQISISLQMVSVQPRSTTWEIQYGIGASPTTWTTLTGGTWADPGVFGSTPFVLNNATDMAAISGQSNVWFRVAALSASTGSGNRDSMAIDNFAITPVPEPTTILGIAAAGIGLVGFVRRRRLDAGAERP